MKTSRMLRWLLPVLSIAMLSACTEGSSAPEITRVRMGVAPYISQRPEAIHIISRVPVIANSPGLAARTRAAEAKYYWMHQLHWIASREMIVEQLKRSEQDRNDLAKTCALAVEITMKTIDRAHAITGADLTSTKAKWNQLRASALQTRCGEFVEGQAVGAMSIFKHVFAPPMRLRTPLDQYAGELETAYENAGYDGEDILNAMGVVMNNAQANLSTDDYEGLAALANIKIQSSVEWQEYYTYLDEGGTGGPCDVGSPYADGPGCEQPMSIFRKQWQWTFVALDWYFLLKYKQVSPQAKKTALADFGGGLGGWKTGRHIGAIAGAAMASLATF